MIERVKKYIRENQMLEAGSMVVAGVSGGADSVAMLHILKSIQKEFDFLEAVHIHHGIRGKEADRDEALVKKSVKNGKFRFNPIIIRFPCFPGSGNWERKKPEGLSVSRLLRKKKRSLVFRKNGKGEWDGFALRWPITAMIWQKPCCIIWREGQAFAAFRGFILAMERLSGRFYV